MKNFDIDKMEISKLGAQKVKTLGILFYKILIYYHQKILKYFKKVNDLNNAFSYCYNLTDILWEGQNI